MCIRDSAMGLSSDNARAATTISPRHVVTMWLISLWKWWHVRRITARGATHNALQEKKKTIFTIYNSVLLFSMKSGFLMLRCYCRAPVTARSPVVQRTAQTCSLIVPAGSYGRPTEFLYKSGENVINDNKSLK